MADHAVKIRVVEDSTGDGSYWLSVVGQGDILLQGMQFYRWPFHRTTSKIDMDKGDRHWKRRVRLHRFPVCSGGR